MVFRFTCEYHHKLTYIVGQKEDQRTTLLAKFGKLCPVFPDEMSKEGKFIDNVHQKMAIAHMDLWSRLARQKCKNVILTIHHIACVLLYL